MATYEHHSQTVVTNFLSRKNRLVRRDSLAIHQMNHFSLFALEDLSAPDDIQREVARRAHDPRGRIFWNPVKRPGLQRACQRLLDHVFSQAEMFDSEDSRQDRNHLSRLVTEKMFHDARNFFWFLDNIFQGRVA